MWAYIVRRIFLTVPIVLGIVLITFVLFRVVAPDPARAHVGKNPSPEQLKATRARMGLDKPLWLDAKALGRGEVGKAFDSQFFNLLFFRFQKSVRYEESLWTLIARKAPASMTVQIPAFFITVGLELALALTAASRRGRMTDYLITIASVLMLSLPPLSLYIFCQWFFGQKLGLFPVAGWDQGIYAIHFAALPILMAVAVGVGSGTRFYRTVVLEEVYADYVRTARAKGVSNREVLFTHVLRNAMIPVITQTVTALPGLILGALLLERIFQIPGLGNLMVESLNNEDFWIVMGMTYVLAIAYCVLLLISDVLYTLVNPQVSLR
jgi:peptide/nickel transport system permease protein